jgi:hypothetical protein
MGRKIDLVQSERETYGLYAQRATDFARALGADEAFAGLDVYAKEELLKRTYRMAHDAAMRQIWASIAERTRAGGVTMAARR